jgi:hypothetical protein
MFINWEVNLEVKANEKGLRLRVKRKINTDFEEFHQHNLEDILHLNKTCFQDILKHFFSSTDDRLVYNVN